MRSLSAGCADMWAEWAFALMDPSQRQTLPDQAGDIFHNAVARERSFAASESGPFSEWRVIHPRPNFSGPDSETGPRRGFAFTERVLGKLLIPERDFR